jgi:thymidylate synthase
MQNIFTKFPKSTLKQFNFFKSPKDLYSYMCEITQNSPLPTIRNFCGFIENMDRDSLAVETELFPKEALEFYTKVNMELINQDTNPEDFKKYYIPMRGGGQGDYSYKFQEKYKHVIECLTNKPDSKRAIISMTHSKKYSHEVRPEDDNEAKCLRELVFYTEDNALHCTGFMRAQSAVIFPKNIHFIGTVLNDIADELKLNVGTYTHFIAHLDYTR